MRGGSLEWFGGRPREGGIHWNQKSDPLSVSTGKCKPGTEVSVDRQEPRNASESDSGSPPITAVEQRLRGRRSGVTKSSFR